MNWNIIRLTDKPAIKDRAAEWFHEKWGIPLTAYQESMEECLEGKKPVPQWYAAMENGKIVVYRNICQKGHFMWDHL